MCHNIGNTCVLIHAISVLIRTLSMPFRTILTLRTLFTLVFCVPSVLLCLRVYMYKAHPYTLRHKGTHGTQNTNVNSALSVKTVLKGMLNVLIRTLRACIRTHAFQILGHIRSDHSKVIKVFKYMFKVFKFWTLGTYVFSIENRCVQISHNT